MVVLLIDTYLHTKYADARGQQHQLSGTLCAGTLVTMA